MRTSKIYSILLLLVIVLIASCEKDDICIDGATPLLVVDFINVADTSLLKNVNDLRVVGLDNNTVFNTGSDRADVNTISIPLRTSENTTRYLLIRNSASNDAGNETGDIDTLVLNYERIETFVDRACGFVITYDELSASVSGSDNWIREVIVTRSQVTSSDSTHVQLSH